MNFRNSITSWVVLMGIVSAGSVVHADYADEVLSDEPFAYWRLGDEDVIDGAFNSAEIDFDPAALNGTFMGDVLLDEDPLILDDPDPAARFNGIDTEVRIPDSSYTNAGGPYQARTTELWFNADVIDEGVRGMIFEGGGTTRGLGIWVEEVDGDDMLFMSMWNRAQESWEPVFVSTEIEEGVTYHAVMVFDASENDDFGDFDGRITGYLNGEEFDTAIGADQLYNHGDNYAIGSVQQNTFYPDGSNPGNGDHFTGIIDEVACYSFALDDPDDDGDFGDSRVMAHFEAGAGDVTVECPRGLAATRDGGNVKLAWEHAGTATSVRVVRNGTELAAAAPVDPPEYVDATAAPGELAYELTFNVDACRTLSRTFRGCITDLEATTSEAGVELAWVNNFAYANIVVKRDDDVIATIAGAEESYVDAGPPGGSWTYSVAPENGDCEPVTAQAVVLDSEYGNLVLADGALAYWTLGEGAGTVAANAGSLGADLDGSYTGNVELEVDGLVPGVPDDTAVGFDGIDAQVLIPDSNLTNVGGPFESKTIELWFQADLIDEDLRMVFEEGGTTNGFSVYVQAVDGEPSLFMVAWSESNGWESVGVSVPVDEETSYHAVMVFDSSENDETGDFDGRVTGYLNGEEFDTAIGADVMANHDNDNSIGAVISQSQSLDNTNLSTGHFFQGVVDDLSLYDIPLDDPDDDGDFEDSRVEAHYLAGIGGGGLGGAALRPGDVNGDAGFNIADMVAHLNFLFGGAALPECYVVPGSDPVALNATGLAILDYNGDGSSNIADAVAGLGGLFGGGGPHFLGEDCVEIEGSCESNCVQ